MSISHTTKNPSQTHERFIIGGLPAKITKNIKEFINFKATLPGLLTFCLIVTTVGEFLNRDLSIYWYIIVALLTCGVIYQTFKQSNL